MPKASAKENARARPYAAHPYKKWSEKTCGARNHRCQTRDRVSGTVVKAWASSSKEGHLLEGDHEKGEEQRVRPLTVDEIAGLQSFPAGYTTTKGAAALSRAERIQGIGNAVPPRLAEAVLQGVRELVFPNTDFGRTIPSVEVCAGIGGLSLGAERAGFGALGLYDFWAPATSVLADHFPPLAVGNGEGERVHTADICEVNFTPYRGRARMLCGGPPCQPFSTGSKRRLGEKDERDLLREMPRIVGEVRPEVFVFENVEGLVQPRNVGYFNRICGEFDALGYDVAAHCFDAKDYGVPQRRKRVFIVGVRRSQHPDVSADSIIKRIQALSPVYMRARPEKGETRDPPRTVGDVVDRIGSETPWFRVLYPTV